MAVINSKRKHEIPPLTDRCIKQGIVEIERRKGKKFESVEELLTYVDKMPA